MEISIYNIHYIVAKFLNLRRHVLIASDWLVLFCSFFCCQCAEYAAHDCPMDGLSEASSVAYQIVPRKVEANTAPSCEDLFNPGTLELEFDQPEEPTCNKYNNCIKHCSNLSTAEGPRGLDGKMTQDDHFSTIFTDINIAPAASRWKNDYPIVHGHKKVPDQDMPEADIK